MGRFPRVRRAPFHSRRATIDGKKVRYTLADQRIRLMGVRLLLQQVTRLSENGHQTPIVTSRFAPKDVEITFRLFERWRQESFFEDLLCPCARVTRSTPLATCPARAGTPWTWNCVPPSNGPSTWSDAAPGSRAAYRYGRWSTGR